MIKVLTGENSFEIDRELKRVIAGFDGRAEKIDGSELELKQLPDLLMGSSLFAEKRLVIIKNLSENKTVWTHLGEWLERVSDDIQLVFVESKPDKRTKTFKELQKAATLQEFKPWGERDGYAAEAWAIEEAKKQGVALTKPLAHKLIERTGIDQWRVFHALEKLAVLDDVTTEMIEEVVDPNPIENIFQLFETALKGDRSTLAAMLRTVELTEDPYQVFGLLSGQAFQLLALASTDKPSGDVAKEIGAHPFVLSKLSSYAKKRGTSGAKMIIIAFAEADEKMKTSVAEPWLLIEQALMKVAQI